MNRSIMCFVLAASLVAIGSFAAETGGYSDDQLLEREVSFLFSHLEKPETGFNIYAAPKGLGKKCSLEPELALTILDLTTQLYITSKSDLVKRQCLLVLTDSGAVVTYPTILHALQNGETRELRVLAAYCLPFYTKNKKASVGALKAALEGEQDKSVRSSIEQSLTRLK